MAIRLASRPHMLQLRRNSPPARPSSPCSSCIVVRPFLGLRFHFQFHFHSILFCFCARGVASETEIGTLASLWKPLRVGLVKKGVRCRLMHMHARFFPPPPPHTSHVRPWFASVGPQRRCYQARAAVTRRRMAFSERRSRLRSQTEATHSSHCSRWKSTMAARSERRLERAAQLQWPRERNSEGDWSTKKRAQCTSLHAALRPAR